jgi:hypothetical protein
MYAASTSVLASTFPVMRTNHELTFQVVYDQPSLQCANMLLGEPNRSDLRITNGCGESA